MRHTLLGARSLLDGKYLSACGPDRNHALALTYLDLFACQLQRGWQPIEDPIVGDIAIPGDLAFFSGEAFPGKVLWQGLQLLLGQTIHWTSMGGAMDASVDTLPPPICLGIRIIQYL